MTFSAAPDAPAGMQILESEADGNVVAFLSNLPFPTEGGTESVFHLLTPGLDLTPRGPVVQGPPRPLVVYVPGSAWLPQNLDRSVPRLAAFAEATGYAVAMVAYRPSTVAKAPAQLHDLKAALNHLQAEHARWNLSADKVVLWGTSSGGHLVSLAGLTAEGGPDIAGVVNFFGPTDFRRMGDFPSVMDHNAPNSPESLVVGGPIQDPEFAEAVAAYNPLTYVDPDKPTPPFLLMHGDRDPLVPFNQSVLLYEALRDAGHDVTFYKLKDAGHGTRFFTPKPLAIVEAFMARVLGN